MPEVSFSVESPESSVAAVPEPGIDAVMQRFSKSDFERSTDHTYSRQSFLELMKPAANSFDVRIAEVLTSHEDALYLASKRAIDILISLAALLVLSPIILLAAFSVKLYDGGPFLFSQIRVGIRGQKFRCFKFRSMVVNAEALQSTLNEQNEHSDQRTFKIMNDPRITPPGRILRRLSVDELP